LVLDQRTSDWAQKKLAEFSSRDYQGKVGINISAGKPNREWEPARYRDLVERLSLQYPQLLFLIFAAPADLPIAQQIAAKLGDNVKTIPDGCSLIEVSALMRGLDCMMSPDTSICHIASSMNLPLVGLYTAAENNYLRWRPWCDRWWVVRPPEGDSLAGIDVDSYFETAEMAISAICQVTPTH
jgi:ADP-heptose:LPS heptosyltransferase